MKILLRGDKLKITDSMKNYMEEKLMRLNKYISDSESVEATVNVKVNSHIHKVEVTLPLKSFILRAEEEKEDYYKSVDYVIDKLERQIKKNKTRLQSQKMKAKKDFILDYIEEVNDLEKGIVKRKKIEIKPMSEEEAIIQMELLGHEFYLFKNEEKQFMVVYKRKDGNYGIIESE